METFVDWWCSLIGVTDPEAIHVAVGIIAAAVICVLLFLVLVILAFFITLITK